MVNTCMPRAHTSQMCSSHKRYSQSKLDKTSLRQYRGGVLQKMLKHYKQNIPTIQNIQNIQNMNYGILIYNKIKIVYFRIFVYFVF